MELRRLRLLHELSRRGTVAAVAQALSFSPSSVSVQLSQLEREAGVALLRRVGRNVELTGAGHRLADYAGRALAADEQVRAELAASADTPRGRLRVTVVQTPALALLPGMFAQLERTAPELLVEVRQRETTPAMEELRSREVDLVVGVEYRSVPVPRSRDVDRRDLIREDVLLALHPGHPALATAGPLSLRAFEDEPWATGHAGTGLDAVVRNVCNRLGGFGPILRHRSDDAIVLSALVASGRAVTLLPALFLGGMPGIVARPVAEEPVDRLIFTAARTTTREAPAVVAARAALHDAARCAARS
jgi:DNA-binding transcriptional LysR family regulator